MQGFYSAETTLGHVLKTNVQFRSAKGLARVAASGVLLGFVSACGVVVAVLSEQ